MGATRPADASHRRARNQPSLSCQANHKRRPSRACVSFPGASPHSPAGVELCPAPPRHGEGDRDAQRRGWGTVESGELVLLDPTNGSFLGEVAVGGNPRGGTGTVTNLGQESAEVVNTGRVAAGIVRSGLS